LLDNNVKLTGVNSKCILNELANFHVTERFSFDIMHDIFEGVAEYDVCKVIMKIIKTKVLALSTIIVITENIYFLSVKSKLEISTIP